MLGGFQLAGDSDVCLILWFPTWVLDSRTKYAVAIFGVVLLGMVHELLSLARKMLEMQRLRRADEPLIRTIFSSILYMISILMGYFMVPCMPLFFFKLMCVCASVS